MYVQLNFSGSNTFGTMKLCLRQAQFEIMSVNQSARSGGIIGISFRFSFKLRYVVCAHYNHLIKAILMSMVMKVNCILVSLSYCILVSLSLPSFLID